MTHENTSESCHLVTSCVQCSAVRSRTHTHTSLLYYFMFILFLYIFIMEYCIVKSILSPFLLYFIFIYFSFHSYDSVFYKIYIFIPLFFFMFLVSLKFFACQVVHLFLWIDHRMLTQDIFQANCLPACLSVCLWSYTSKFAN